MVDFDISIVDADRACPDLSGSIDAVRSGGNFDLSAYAAFRCIGTGSDNVKMMEDVKMKMEDNVEKRNERMNYLTTNFK
jgi:hypothetical protein